MASKFSCSLRYSDALKLKNMLLVYSDGFDEYKVKYRSNVCRDLILSIAWTIPKQALVTVKLYSKKFRKCFSSKGNVVNGCETFLKLRGGFNICSSPEYSILCLIDIMPFVQFKQCAEKCSGSDGTLEKVDPLPPVVKLPLDMNNKICDNSAESFEEKCSEASQTNNFKEPDKISEMLRNELIASGTHAGGDRVTASSPMNVYKVAIDGEAFVNTNSCLTSDAERQTCLLGDINGAEQKRNIVKAIAENSSVTSNLSAIVGESELYKNSDRAPCTEDFVMTGTEESNVQEPVQQTSDGINPFQLNLPEISNNQDMPLCIKTVCTDIAIDYSNSLISNDFSINSSAVMDIKSIGTSEYKNDPVGNASKTTDIELNAASEKKNNPIEVEAEYSSVNECNLLDDVDGAITTETDVHEMLYEEIDLTMGNEPLDLSEDKTVLLLNDIEDEIKSETEMDIQFESISDKVYENKGTIEISTSGDINIALSDLDSTLKSSELTNSDELMIAEDILNKSDSGIDLNMEDKYVRDHSGDSLKADIGNPKGTNSCISTETNLNSEVETLLDNKNKHLTNAARPACDCKEYPVTVDLSSSTEDSLMYEELTILTNKCSSAKTKKIEDSEIRNTHSNKTKLIESSIMNTNEIPALEFQPQYPSTSNGKVSPVAADHCPVDKDPHAESKFFTAKANLVSETLIKKCSPQVLRNISTKSGGTAKRGAVTKLSESALSTNRCAQAFPVMETRLKGLSMNMLDLLMSGNMSDAVISNGKREVKVHKAILSARSPVLKKIFTELAKENLENRVRVNVPNYIIEDLIVFMYAGLVNIKSVKMAQDLCKIAKRYCIKDLIDVCSKYISKSLENNLKVT